MVDCYRASPKRNKYSKDKLIATNESDRNNFICDPEITNSEYEEEDENSGNRLETHSSCTKQKDLCNTPIQEQQTKRVEEKSEDSLKVFFDSMYAATKYLPKHLQQRIKRNVFKIVLDAEDEVAAAAAREADNSIGVNHHMDFSNNTNLLTSNTPITNSCIKVEPSDDFTCDDINEESINMVRFFIFTLPYRDNIDFDE